MLCCPTLTAPWQGTEPDASHISCVPCPSGQFSVLGVCQDCIAGKTSSTGALVCDNCPRGTTSSANTSFMCEACPSGKISDRGQPCSACAAGTEPTPVKRADNCSLAEILNCACPSCRTPAAAEFANLERIASEVRACRVARASSRTSKLAALVVKRAQCWGQVITHPMAKAAWRARQAQNLMMLAPLACPVALESRRLAAYVCPARPAPQTQPTARHASPVLPAPRASLQARATDAHVSDNFAALSHIDCSIFSRHRINVAIACELPLKRVSVCSAGHVALGGEGSTCETCPAGSQPSADGGHCEACPSGSFSLGLVCEVCGAGFQPDAEQTSCQSCSTLGPNFFSTSGDQCFECPALMRANRDWTSCVCKGTFHFQTQYFYVCK